MNAPSPPSTPSTPSGRPQLAIDGLPPALATLAAGQVCIVYANESPARAALFWNTAAAALHNGPANVLSTRNDLQIVDALRSHGLDIDGVGALHGHANLCTLRPLPDRDGGEVLLEALKALADQCAQPESEFLIDGADAFFNWHDASALARQGAQLAAWCAHHDHGVLLVVSLPDDGGDSSIAQASALAGFHVRFAGAAHLRQTGGQYVWEAMFWGQHGAMLVDESLPLRFLDDSDRLMVAGGTFAKSIGEGGRLAPDEARVIVSRDAVARESGLPSHWEVVDDNDAVVAAAAHAVAATVLLAYGDSAQLEKLAEQVYTLRRSAGPALKIAVREDRIALRYQAVMRSLGTNLVVPQQTSLARVETMLDELQGQVFSRPLPADYLSVLAAVLHSPEVGYVSASRFVELVRDTVGRARAIRLPNVLLRLPLLPEVAHVDALQACHMGRAGDLCTACGDSVYTFFFSCRLADVTTVFQRVFQLPPGDLFRGEVRCGDYDSIMSMLETLEREITHEPPLDYTQWLAQQRRPVAPAATAAGAPASGGLAPVSGDGGGAASAATAHEPEAAPVNAAMPRAAPTPANLPFKTRG
ncbi:cellulose biosynthesis protein BcsE [Paraburkholderia susongensis]|uniref:Cellulose biosynthesis protein BcsE n=1 Tax=Paraburkholderia susongensis TaxID=1515439 RepID=A0A1X7LR90_9BURK|nr:cellulose biosynthesis protein BcsE [Paraburkholderia susongensis]SMG56391.1 cellulose biosynthesis protein BcsE [Paraburkholderia susongensis]